MEKITLSDPNISIYLDRSVSPPRVIFIDKELAHDLNKYTIAIELDSGLEDLLILGNLFFDLYNLMKKKPNLVCVKSDNRI